MATKIRASIIGITGFTGIELFRILVSHPNVEIRYLTSRHHDDVELGSVVPHLAGYPYKVNKPDLERIGTESDVVFLALPHKTAQQTAATLLKWTRVIDLSADFRLKSQAVYERVYGVEHNHPELLETAVYGVPEFDSKLIESAKLLANPGCFALLSQMLLFPFAGDIESVDLFAITGSSGAGKTENPNTHHPIRNHNIYSYKINCHRHIPEILATAKIDESQLNFVPNSGPFTRGIFATAFVSLRSPISAEALQLRVKEQYVSAPFVRLREQQVRLASIVASNFVDLHYRPINGQKVLAQGCLDNVTKGSGGNAIQCMNLMFGLDEGLGLLGLAPVYP